MRVVLCTNIAHHLANGELKARMKGPEFGSSGKMSIKSAKAFCNELPSKYQSSILTFVVVSIQEILL